MNAVWFYLFLSALMLAAAYIWHFWGLWQDRCDRCAWCWKERYLTMRYWPYEQSSTICARHHREVRRQLARRHRARRFAVASIARKEVA